MADHRTLITHLCDELDHYRRMLLDDRQVTHPLADRARAALAADGPTVPEVVEPTDEELWQVGDEDFRANTWPTDAIRYARAVLACHGRPAPAPAGEVAELVRKLREQAATYNAHPGHEPLIEEWARCFTRAADLLERQTAPVPVAVSERLPRTDDCDAEGRCWWYGDGEDMVGWTFQDLEGLSYYKATHWLPAQALPLPTTEPQP